MKVKDDKNLKHLAGRASKTPETISSIIIDYCPKWDILINDSFYFGKTLRGCIDLDTLILDVFKDMGISRIKYSDYMALMNLTLLGDGDCPECGSFMEVTDYECSLYDDEEPPKWVEKNVP
ncbi:MAG: hypothetical protein [Bacteriophage sp.]|nr:MAG: hypothetical protein [Bacteriophage sp.]